MTALPHTSDVNLFGNGQRVINLYAKVPDRTLNLCMPEQKLHSP